MKYSTKKLTEILNELDSCIVHKDVQSEAVSQAAIGWHLEHSMMVIHAIVEALKDSDPSKFKRKFNFAKFYVYTLGRIPLKKGRAPKAVTPTTPASIDELNKWVATCREDISSLSELEAGKYFKHPIFGNLQLKDTIKFLELHTEHHLKIMRAIKA